MNATGVVDGVAPVFLVGAERSGTTLFRLMLDHHPEISFHEEFDYAVWENPEGGGEPDLPDYLESLAGDRVFQLSGFEVVPGLGPRDLARSFLEQRRQASGKPIVGATIHHHFDRILKVWPDARFIHLIRDPRDVARSAVRMGWAGNVWTAVDLWLEAERLWDGLRETLPAHRRHEVRFMELVSDPERILRQVCEFIGTDYDPAMLSYPEDTSYGPPTPSLAGQWRRSLEKCRADVQLVEAKAGEVMIARGYEPSGLPAPTIDGRELLRLRLGDRAGRAMFRLKRYGPALLLAGSLSRRTGLFQSRALRRFHEIDNAHLH